jgi:DNA-binding PadR family transcriptional regulator
MKGEMLKGHLDMIVLAALSSGPAHGYAVIEEISGARAARRSIFQRGRFTRPSTGSNKPVCLFPVGKLLTLDDGGGSMR